MLRSPSYTLFSAAALCAATVGCQGNTPATSEPQSTASPAGPSKEHGHDHDDHDHPSEGPHHGVLVELGSEEYHAEVVHDDASGAVTVYLLDSSAKKPVTSDTKEITINLKHGDKPEQFKLAAQPQDGDAAGQSSRFAITDKELAEHLHEAATQPRLSLTVGGQPYSGAIPHESHGDHDHDHDHDHDK